MIELHVARWQVFFIILSQKVQNCPAIPADPQYAHVEQGIPNTEIWKEEGFK